MQDSHEFFNVVLIFSDILPITDGLSKRGLSIQALGFKKKKNQNKNHGKCTVLTYHKMLTYSKTRMFHS